jgi:hypothetical protein
MDRRGSCLSRRGFVAGATGLELVAGCGPLPEKAQAGQQPSKEVRLDLLRPVCSADRYSAFGHAFLQRLRQLSSEVGKSLPSAYRAADHPAAACRTRSPGGNRSAHLEIAINDMSSAYVTFA